MSATDDPNAASQGVVAQSDETHLESEWCDARNAADENLRNARAKRDALGVYDERIASARRRRDAIEASLLSTCRGAKNRGALTSAGTKFSISRFKVEMEAARDEARRLVEEAAPLCQDFDVACEELSAARRLERDALQRYMTIRELRDLALQEEKRRTAELMGEVARLERLHQLEVNEKQRDDKWADSGAFDPKYDPWEIWLRRRRPWL